MPHESGPHFPHIRYSPSSKHGISFISFQPKTTPTKPWLDFVSYLVEEAGGAELCAKTALKQCWLRRGLRDYAPQFVRTLTVIPSSLIPPNSHAANVDGDIEGRLVAVDFQTDEVVFMIDNLSQKKLQEFYVELNGDPNREQRNPRFTQEMKKLRVKMKIVDVIGDSMFGFEKIFGGLFGLSGRRSPRKTPGFALRGGNHTAHAHSHDHEGVLKNEKTLPRSRLSRLNAVPPLLAGFLQQRPRPSALTTVPVTPDKTVVSSSSSESSGVTVIRSKPGSPKEKGNSPASLPPYFRTSKLRQSPAFYSAPSSPTHKGLLRQSYKDKISKSPQPCCSPRPKLLMENTNYVERLRAQTSDLGIRDGVIYPDSSASIVSSNSSSCDSSSLESSPNSHPSIYHASPVNSPMYRCLPVQIAAVQTPATATTVSPLIIFSPATQLWHNGQCHHGPLTMRNIRDRDKYEGVPFTGTSRQDAASRGSAQDNKNGPDEESPVLEYGYETPRDNDSPEPPWLGNEKNDGTVISLKRMVECLTTENEHEEYICKAAKDGIDNHPISVRLRQVTGQTVSLKEVWEHSTPGAAPTILGDDKVDKVDTKVKVPRKDWSLNQPLTPGDAYQGLYGADFGKSSGTMDESEQTILTGEKPLHVPKTRRRPLPIVPPIQIPGPAPMELPEENNVDTANAHGALELQRKTILKELTMKFEQLRSVEEKLAKLGPPGLTQEGAHVKDNYRYVAEREGGYEVPCDKDVNPRMRCNQGIGDVSGKGLLFSGSKEFMSGNITEWARMCPSRFEIYVDTPVAYADTPIPLNDTPVEDFSMEGNAPRSATTDPSPCCQLEPGARLSELDYSWSLQDRICAHGMVKHLRQLKYPATSAADRILKSAAASNSEQWKKYTIRRKALNFVNTNKDNSSTSRMPLEDVTSPKSANSNHIGWRSAKGNFPTLFSTPTSVQSVYGVYEDASSTMNQETRRAYLEKLARLVNDVRMTTAADSRNDDTHAYELETVKVDGQETPPLIDLEDPVSRDEEYLMHLMECGMVGPGNDNNEKERYGRDEKGKEKEIQLTKSGLTSPMELLSLSEGRRWQWQV